MKTIFIFIMASLLFTQGPLAQTQDEKAVASAVETLRKALIEATEATLKDITDDALSYGHSSGMIEDKAGFIGRLVRGESDFVTIELSEQTISITGDIAIVRHKLVAETNDNGKPGNPKLFVMLVWRKDKKGKWKMLARQATKVPQP
jgi:ketosteroid isomerase-like protein